MDNMPITKAQQRKLMALAMVVDVENEGMDEGRFFVHLKKGFEYPFPYSGQRTKSFGSFNEAFNMVRRVVKVEAE